MPIHTVSQGECVMSIADAAGFTWETVWNDGRNAKLKEKRKDPNVLQPGDELYIPDRDVKKVSRPTGARHKFVKTVAKARVHVRLLDGDKPRGGVPYTLLVDDVPISGSTTGDGFIKHDIPAGAKRGKLTVGTGKIKEEYEFEFGTVDPVDSDAGVAGRLKDLGYVTDDLKAAVSAFQHKEKMTVTGEVDQAMRDRLKERFGQ
jgi:hypothetical protein